MRKASTFLFRNYSLYVSVQHNTKEFWCCNFLLYNVEDYYCFIWVNIDKFCVLTSTENGKVKLSSRNNLISSRCNTFHKVVGWSTPFKPELSLYYIKSKAFVWCIWSRQSFPFESFFFVICLVFCQSSTGLAFVSISTALKAARSRWSRRTPL